jgi:flagellar biosynthetic protein FlhB
MADADSDQDKSEAATPYKLEQARRKGQTARSIDGTVAALFAAVTVLWYAMGANVADSVMRLCRSVFTGIAVRQWSADGASAYLAEFGWQAFAIVVPLMIVVALAVGLMAFAQVGPILSADPVKPSLDKVNPISGFKRLFSLRLLFDTAKGVAKLLALGAVVWFSARSAEPELAALSLLPVASQAAWMHITVGALLVKLTAVLVLIGAIDVGYVRWEFAKKMRMSHRDIKDEHKHREGDPRIRNRLRELRLKMLKRSGAMRNLPDADVVITNPTHISVALAYKHGEMAAPRLLAKGAGEMARKLREGAYRHGIPVVRNPPLARELYKRLEVEQWVPEDLYPTVARILVWVYAQRQARASGVTA